MDFDKPLYNSSSSESKINSYRRINHCSEVLDQFQGKETTDIDQVLLNQIIEELKVFGILDLVTVTRQNVKAALKSLGKSSKSEHATLITNKLNGVAVKTIPHELLEIVKAMWIIIEDTWYIYKDSSRKNFMNSSYVFHKIFELLDEPQLAEKWPYLADDKLKKYDVLWEKITSHLGWEYIPSTR
eukprot:scaffold3141_cov162-Ochromonas_danica.AAC.1